MPSARRRKIVLTGGPGAGKTAVLELARRHFGARAEVLYEAASIVFTGGFPRQEGVEAKSAAQRAIYHVQVELENVARAQSEAAVILCDRGTPDGLAYWPGAPAEYWSQLRTSLAEELARYDAVIHLRTPSRRDGYHRDAVRTENAKTAELIDGRLLEIWATHPRRFLVESSHDFVQKTERTLAILEQEMTRSSTDVSSQPSITPMK
jgi:predicted ATPase